MRSVGAMSWQMRVDRWSEAADRALWLRAVERIDAPAGGLVPGPLDEDELPDPSPDAGDPALPAAWLRWWSAIAAGVTPDARPDLDVLAAEPALSHVLDRRFDEWHRWHAARKRASGFPLGPDPLRETRLVAALERRLGRKAAPFVLDLLVLPVRDDEIRRAGRDRYLVPARVYDSPDWPARLEPLVLSRFD